MRMLLAFLGLLPMLLAGCAQHQPVSRADVSVPPSGNAPRPDWSHDLGRTVTVEGYAVDMKLGAFLAMDTTEGIWLDGLSGWPAGFWNGGERGKHLRVTGTVIEKDDLPVFVIGKQDVPVAGLGAASEAEAKKMRHRYLLKDATWKTLD